MIIRFNTEESWLRGCAAFVREGVTFTATERYGSGLYWAIEFTGGY